MALRLSGKRTLAKMNAFDLVITVSFGSALATVALSSDVSLIEGVVAFAVFCLAQAAVAASSVTSTAFRGAVKSEPTLLVHDGRMLSDAIAAERLTPGEVRQAIRASGSGAIEDVGAVVLETDGSLSVIDRSAMGTASALLDVASTPARTTDEPPSYHDDAG